MSQNPHDFTNNLPSMHSCKIYHTNFKYTSCQATGYMPTFSFLISQDTVRFPPEALLMCRVWLCFPSLSTSWSHWGFGTCNWGSQASPWEVLTGGPRWAEQLCRVSVTTVPQPRERNTNSRKQTQHQVFMSRILVFHKTKGSKTQRWQVCFFICFLEPNFSAAGMNVLFWILWFCFNDRIKDLQNYKVTL